ncbi:hypothetical protein FQN53_001567 [Emmonsiellopsis sp. PD_33]|nr:hypothetical protein FQN53_001567 [Emmonsiellopsis sp. PD_33]KAK2798562.1 hypothetical protein FQN51_007582 [Onygenales sp. PD_10]
MPSLEHSQCPSGASSENVEPLPSPNVSPPTLVDHPREPERWISLSIYAGMEDPFAPTISVPNPSPTRSVQDSDGDTPRSASLGGSISRRRRHGEYYHRPPVWNIQRLDDQGDAASSTDTDNDPGFDSAVSQNSRSAPACSSTTHDQFRSSSLPHEWAVLGNQTGHGPEVSSAKSSTSTTAAEFYGTKIKSPCFPCAMNSSSPTEFYGDLYLKDMYEPPQGPEQPALCPAPYQVTVNMCQVPETPREIEDAGNQENRTYVALPLVAEETGLENANPNVLKARPLTSTPEKSQTKSSPQAHKPGQCLLGLGQPQGEGASATQRAQLLEEPKPASNIFAQEAQNPQYLPTYKDIRVFADGTLGYAIEPGSRVICVDDTSLTERAPRPDAFSITRGDTYVVLEVYGDLWARCIKVSLARSVASEIQNLERRRKIAESNTGFLPLCAVTLDGNFGKYLAFCSQRIGISTSPATGQMVLPPERSHSLHPSRDTAGLYTPEILSWSVYLSIPRSQSETGAVDNNNTGANSVASNLTRRNSMKTAGRQLFSTVKNKLKNKTTNRSAGKNSDEIGESAEKSSQPAAEVRSGMILIYDSPSNEEAQVGSKKLSNAPEFPCVEDGL